jgi:phytoene dehydrogenase-like protein
VLRMFIDGDAALPAGGLGAAVEQLAESVRASGGEIYLNTRAEGIQLGDAATGRRHTVMLEGGRQLTCDRLVLACTSREARRLLSSASGAGCEGMESGDGEKEAGDAVRMLADDAPAVGEPAPEGATTGSASMSQLASRWLSEYRRGGSAPTGPYLESLPEERPYLESICVYFALAGRPPVREPCLILNGRGAGAAGGGGSIINNMCFPSVACPAYAPPGQHLASVTIVPAMLGAAAPAWLKEDTALEAAVSQLTLNSMPPLPTVFTPLLF